MVILLAVLAVQLAPESWFTRMESIKTAEEDLSFMGRVVAWKVSTAIALANPWGGGGLHAIQSMPVWHEFVNRIDFLSFIPTPPPAATPRAAHSIYFEVLGDLGFVGFALYIGLIVNAFLTARRIRRLVANRPELLWARDLSDGLKLALVAYCVGGAGVSLAYFDLFYVVIMLLEALRQHLITATAPQTTSKYSNAIQGEVMPGRAT
jgi:probable O-glycosylation ligase (exosortase A-associated)